MLTEIDSVTMAMIMVFVLVLLGMIVGALTQKFSGFCRDLRYIKMEIERTVDSEQEYWKQEKRRLWLSLLPFFRR